MSGDLTTRMVPCFDDDDGKRMDDNFCAFLFLCVGEPGKLICICFQRHRF